MERLEQLSTRLAEGDESVREDFQKELAGADQIETLRDLAERNTPHTDVSRPIYERLLEIDPGDVAARAALGFVFFLDGDDELAWEQVREGHAVDPGHPDVLLLEAALTRVPEGKVALYRQVLARDPHNSVALANLRALGS